ncbi:CBO0543 family protein [Priestia megaterium]|uniref:CBO0543 family protein n=1 Tax=Priestia megaterium TaxID=1404 RepID=UPI002FE32A12
MTYPSYDEVQDIRRELKEVGYQNWLHSDLFTWQWWVLLIAAILPWVIWGYLIEKKHRLHVFAFAMSIGIISSILDVIGADNLLWGYPTKLFFMVPPLIPADLTVIPVAFSLAYHYGKTWRRYILYIIIISFLFAYVIEPLSKWAEIYQKNNFPHWLSFIGFILLSLIVRWFLERVLPIREYN